MNKPNAVARAKAWVANDVREFEALIGSWADPNDQGYNAWRGESQPFDKSCVPSIVREDSLKSLAGSNLTVTEEARIESFRRRHYSCALRDTAFAPMVTRDGDTPGWWAFAQHHQGRTRLLDASRNPLKALYFATESDSSPASAAMDGFVLGMRVSEEMEPPLGPLTHRNCFDERGQRWEDANPWVRFDASASNAWLVAQEGLLAWRPRIERPDDHHWSNGVVRLMIPADRKERILDELAERGITHLTLFPPLC